MIVRAASVQDLPAIEKIHRTAFAASAMGHNGEAELVRSLYADGDLVCSLVADDDGLLIGHALFSSMDVEADGRSLRAAALAPVAVLPEAQQGGIGAALIDAGLTISKLMVSKSASSWATRAIIPVSDIASNSLRHMNRPSRARISWRCIWTARLRCRKGAGQIMPRHLRGWDRI